MSRTVGCEMIDVDNSNSTNEIVLNVDLDFCLNFSKSEMPAEVAECNSNFMCPVRFAAAFGQVSYSAYKGMLFRLLFFFLPVQ